jgi:hypothetical protein
MSACAAARLLALTVFVIGTERIAAAPDATTLIAGLARTAPASIAFAEVRFS